MFEIVDDHDDGYTIYMYSTVYPSRSLKWNFACHVTFCVDLETSVKRLNRSMKRIKDYRLSSCFSQHRFFFLSVDFFPEGETSVSQREMS